MLKCLVSGDSNHFTIKWYHSKSQPNISDTANESNIITGSTSNPIMNVTNNRSRTSNLTINKFDDMQNGYYWCSVKLSKDSKDTLTNPSRVVHILHQSPGCSTETGMCNRLSIYSESPTLRCADQEISLEIVEAQDCTFTEDMTTAVPNSNSLSPPTMLIAVVAGGILLLLTVVILMCVLKMKVKLPKGVNKINFSSPFDNIHMNISFGEDKIKESQRASTMLCESNPSYKHSSSIMANPLPTEHIYETVH